MINRKATALSLTAISILFSSAVFADDSGSVSDQMTVKLTVEKSCKVSVDDMDFGSHGSNDGAVTASAKAYVTCTNGTGYMLGTDKTHDFEMSSNDTANAKKVAYTLSTDHPGGTSLADNGISAIGTGEQQALPIFGKVTANALKQASAGDYTDTVTLTVTY
ncbi:MULTISPECIES: Csu type fimbrial protein [Citrobacter]|uniref:Spore coat protein U domain-containing protein n=1 Tax=Citrobacter portucalensis TaxID=1639133 RepID=A0AAJ1NG46_9ENTR|nr:MULTISPECIES: spore coat protein U domain-containing protein [Citrobacter]EHA3706640.1 fimbrial major subunit CsuA/B family protein [Citrobacter freundii]RXM23925.1 hypothetical protein EO238_17575 [Citrobacter sp. AAK_AS5]EJD6666043.1 spore coat protein U domain-containing protein [Citrobacter freundii]KAA0567794.1 hypothetical protein F0326_11560 [Citrobacter portucalensis]MBN4855291.1 spore coat protein U domain-containing protein [Citrobacter freundii]